MGLKKEYKLVNKNILQIFFEDIGMTGEKRTETRMGYMLTLCVFTPPLPACIVYDCREGRGVIIEKTQSTC